MNKVAKIEIAVIIILILCIGLYLLPYLTGGLDKKKEARVVANAAVFTSKTLANFSINKKEKASVVAKKTADELNTLSKNPFNKKLPAYVFEKPQAGSVIVSSDDELQTVTVTGLGKENKIVVRTVIKPPSFVTYQKYEDKKWLKI